MCGSKWPLSQGRPRRYFLRRPSSSASRIKPCLSLSGFAFLFYTMTVTCGLSGIAQAAEPSLPGGASTLREVHGDWTVACAVQASQGGGKAKHCALSQQQISQQTRQRALAIELTPEIEGAKGTLVLPFGLNLTSGIVYRLDDGQAGAVLSFRTCLPAGCIVDLAFDTVASLRAGNQLKIITTADGGQEITFSISLTGFSSAYDRVAELMQ